MVLGIKFKKIITHPHRLFTFLIFLFLMPFSYAINDYTELGHTDNRYERGNTRMANTLEYQIYSRVLGDGRKYPLVADMDNDGVYEIIVLDGDSFVLYHDKELVQNNSYAVPGGNLQYSNFIVFDIDADSYEELIFVNSDAADERLFILEFNGTSFHNQTSIALNLLPNHDNGNFLIKCGDTNDCMMAYKQNVDAVAANELMIAPFNSTFVGNASELTVSQASQNHCFPKIPHMVYENYDGWGNAYIFTTIFGLGGTDTLSVHIVKVNDTNALSYPINYESYSKTIGDVATPGSLHCETYDLGKYITSPMVMDISAGSPDEVIVGYSPEWNTFKITAFDNSGPEEELSSAPWPFALNGEGEILGNVFKMDAFGEDSTGEDFCLTGFDNTDLKLYLLCANPTRSTVESKLYSIQYDSGDLSSEFNLFNTLSHSIEHDGVDRVLTSFGMFGFEEGLIVGDLNLIWTNPLIVNSSLISADVEGFNLEDFIAVTDTNIWYFDDDYAFSGAEINLISIDPCTSATWKVSDAFDDNITREVDIKYTVTDADGHNVMARSAIYEDTLYNQTDNWKGPTGSGANFHERYVINVTTTTGILRIYANDTSNPTEIAILERPFTVSTSGVEEGGCVETTAEDNVTTEEEQELLDFQENNTIINTLDNMRETGGWDLPNTAIWLLLMVIAGGTIVYQGFKSDKNPHMVFASVGTFLTLLFILGIYLGFVDVIWLWITIIIALAIIGFKVRSMATGV